MQIVDTNNYYPFGMNHLTGDAPSNFGQGSNTQYLLELKEDNLFDFSIKGHDYRPECSGVWKQEKDTLELKCSDNESIADKLSNGYMNQREFKIKIKSKNRLQLDNVVLKIKI